VGNLVAATATGHGQAKLATKTVAAQLAQTTDLSSVDWCVPVAATPWPSCIAPRSSIEASLWIVQLAESTLESEQYGTAVQFLLAYLEPIERHGSYDARVRAYALLGHGYHQLRAPQQASLHLKKALELGLNIKALQWLQGLGNTRQDELRRTRLRDAVARAGFIQILLNKQRNVDSLVLASFTGAKTRKAIARYINEQAAPWLKKKKAAIATAERELKKFAFPIIGEQPPVRWQIAAATTVGTMWSELHQTIRGLPYPRLPHETPCEVVSSYYSAMTPLTRQWEQRAKGAFEVGLTRSTVYGVFTRYSAQCERWLSRNYPAEYSALEEFIPPLLLTSERSR